LLPLGLDGFLGGLFSRFLSVFEQSRYVFVFHAFKGGLDRRVPSHGGSSSVVVPLRVQSASLLEGVLLQVQLELFHLLELDLVHVDPLSLVELEVPDSHDLGVRLEPDALVPLVPAPMIYKNPPDFTGLRVLGAPGR